MTQQWHLVLTKYTRFYICVYRRGHEASFFFFAFKLYGVCGNRRNSHINFTTILHWLILGCPPFPVRPKLRVKGSPTNHPDFWNPEHHFFHQTSILPWFLGSIHEKFRSGVSFVRRFRWVSLMQVHVIWVAWDGLDLVGALVQKTGRSELRVCGANWSWLMIHSCIIWKNGSLDPTWMIIPGLVSG